MKTKELLITLIALSMLTSCKKESTDYRLQGKVTNGRTGEALTQCSAEVMKQVVSGGTFGGSYSSAAKVNTDATGCFRLQWPRENFSALKLVVAKSQYISKEDELVISDFEGGRLVTNHVVLYPEAFIRLHITNEGLSSPSDLFSFTFTNAHFDCLCCTNGFKTFQGGNVDTTWKCKIYGDTWLKYQKQINTIEGDTVVNDSIWCTAFDTTFLNISY